MWLRPCCSIHPGKWTALLASAEVLIERIAALETILEEPYQVCDLSQPQPCPVGLMCVKKCQNSNLARHSIGQKSSHCLKARLELIVPMSSWSLQRRVEHVQCKACIAVLFCICCTADALLQSLDTFLLLYADHADAARSSLDVLCFW